MMSERDRVISVCLSEAEWKALVARHPQPVHWLREQILNELELEVLNRTIVANYDAIADAEQRSDAFECDDAEVLIVACNTPARMAKGAIRTLRDRGIKAGLFRPLTLWPFPIRALAPLLDRAQRVVVVEASAGQLEDELRLAVSRSGARRVPIDRVNRYGGMLPSHDEIVECVVNGCGAPASKVVA
jgi:pyruvate/2-oxoacid:ferredoxin oxidoreductase alpha subunit